MNPKEHKILSSRLTRAEFFPDYIENNTYGKFVIAKFFKWFNSANGKIDSAVITYKLPDIYDSPLFIDSRYPWIVEGVDKANVAYSLKKPKADKYLSEWPGDIWITKRVLLNHNIRLVYIDLEICNKRKIRTDDNISTDWVDEYNSGTGRYERVLRSTVTKSDIYGNDEYYKLKIQFRNSFEEEWQDMIAFNALVVKDGTRALTYDENTTILDYESIGFDRTFCAEHKDKTDLINELYLKLKEEKKPKPEFISMTSLFVHLSNVIQKYFPESLMVRGFQSSLDLIFENQWTNQKVDGLAERISHAKKFAAPANALKGVWFNKKTKDFWFIENENDVWGQRLPLDKLSEGYSYTEFLEKFSVQIFKDTYKTANSFVKISAIE